MLVLCAAALVAVTARLLEASSTADASLAEWTRLAEVLRGLRLETPVMLREQSRRDVRAHVTAEISRIRTEAELLVYRDAYTALGVLPADLDLRALLVDVYGERLAGRYSRAERTLYLFGDRRRAPDYHMIAVHELVHALQDEHFPRVLALLEGVRHNDDLVLALAAVVEGDATLTMLRARSAGETRVGPGDVDAAIRRQTEARSDGALARAPEWVRASLAFPYTAGLRRAAERHAEAGNEGLNALLTDPPLSSRELLHGTSEDDAFSALEIVRLPLSSLARTGERDDGARDAAQEGCRVAHDNVAGVLTLRSLLAGGAEAAAIDGVLAGWRGDRFAHVACARESGLVWITRWRDAEAARAFADLYARAVVSRPGVRVEVEDRSVAVAQGVLETAGRATLRATESRSYAALDAWVADACFGEPAGCPALGPRADPASR
jgi:hypothetical protein